MKYFLILMLISSVAYAQEEVTLFKTQTPVKGFSRQGQLPTNAKSVSLVKITGAQAVIVKNAKNGFVIKAGNDVYKYDLNLTPQWKTVLPETTFGIGQVAQMKVHLGEAFTYFSEKGTHPNAKQRVVISRVDDQGKVIQAEYKPKKSQNVRFEEEFVLNDNFMLLTKSWSAKRKAIAYDLSIYDGSNHGFVTKQIDFPNDDYELSKVSFQNMRRYYWTFLTVVNDKAVFVKSYFKDIEGQKKVSKMIIKVIEMSPDGTLSEERELLFEPVLAGEDRLFVEPAFAFNDKDNSLTVTGYLGIDRKRINALYLLKYDYSTLMLTYKKEHAFNEILKSDIKPKFKAHYNIPENVDNVYPLRIRSSDILVDNANRFIDLRIITNYDLNSVTFFEVKFDKYGDHVKTGIVEYRQLIKLYDNAIPKPNGYQFLWSDLSKDYVSTMKNNAWDYINSKANSNNSDDTWWFPLVTPSVTILIKFDQENSTFSAISFRE